jgi:hypothetical protein
MYVDLPTIASLPLDGIIFVTHVGLEELHSFGVFFSIKCYG